MTQLIIPLNGIKQSRVFSFKIDTQIHHYIDIASKRFGFNSKSDFVRFIVCGVLKELKILSEEEEPLCYPSIMRLENMWKEEPDNELLLALENITLELKKREALSDYEILPPIHRYAQLLYESLALS